MLLIRDESVQHVLLGQTFPSPRDSPVNHGGGDVEDARALSIESSQEARPKPHAEVAKVANHPRPAASNQMVMGKSPSSSSLPSVTHSRHIDWDAMSIFSTDNESTTSDQFSDEDLEARFNVSKPALSVSTAPGYYPAQFPDVKLLEVKMRLQQDVSPVEDAVPVAEEGKAERSANGHLGEG